LKAGDILVARRQNLQRVIAPFTIYEGRRAVRIPAQIGWAHLGKLHHQAHASLYWGNAMAA
jgi:hypothetical protein